MQIYIMTTTLGCFEPASQIIAQRNPNAKWSQFWPTNDERVNTRQLQQRKSSRQYLRGCSQTLAEDVDYNKAWFQMLATCSLGDTFHQRQVK